MLAYDDRRTVDALRQLLHQAENPERPIALWIGAGASAWSNYPLWGALAADMHRDFSRFNGTYPKQKCVDLLQSQAFPAIFQICRDLDRQRYFRLLAQAFAAHPATPVYERFINTLRELVPLQIITTNVDELLEQHLPTATLIQQSDFERCVTMLHTRTSFIAKLHGSISSINSTVFTTQDYEELTKNESYLTLTSHLFRTCTVVFIGTSLADNYLIDL
jgi:NAD-dependent SIR2 family protein deacetylase